VCTTETAEDKKPRTTIHRFSELESQTLSREFELSRLFRKMRLLNPFDETTLEYKIFDQQMQYNIPMLLFMCRKLANILVEENRKKVLFLSRDGCLIRKLFAFLYPQFESVYFYSSRIINYHYNDEYISYLKKEYNDDDCILFDLHGSFDSGRKMFMETFGYLPRIFIFDLSNINNHYEKMTYISNMISNKIEIFNHDMMGSLLDFKKDKIIHMPTEISPKYIKQMHDAMETFIQNVTDKSILLESSLLNDDSFWKNYYKDSVLNCETLFENTFFHNENTLTYLANKYCSDKGNSYLCAHQYTVKYQEIISDILRDYYEKGKTDFIDLLEIGLNRDNYISIPSLMMWKDYFYKRVNITGFDIQPHFLQFNSTDDNIRIIIGDQSNIADLQPLKDKKYDIIIDDGSHESKNQQISFKTLWENVKSGGYYIIESLHYQPHLETGMKTRQLLENWKENNWIESDFISLDEIQTIKDSIEYIEFFDSHSKSWDKNLLKNAFVYMKKK
jgi:hypothetical protein